VDLSRIYDGKTTMPA